MYIQNSIFYNEIKIEIKMEHLNKIYNININFLFKNINS